jgi:UDP-N-acetylmuramoyl-L-alanyl-D-glutamate--2,6-diaminopimelate ligase
MALQTLKRLLPNDSPARLLWHRSKAFTAALRYGFPAKKLTVIGVTGTDGKTTTVGMIAHILHENGIKVGALSTAFFRINDHVEWNATQKTSPSPFIVQKFLRDLVKAGCTHAVLEYSSHGLVQGRTLFTYPQIAGITNISEEHLDYHGSMEEYIRAKGKLFAMLKKGGTKVLNGDDRTYASYKDIKTDWTTTYSSQKPIHPPMNNHEYSLWASDIRVAADGSNAMIEERAFAPNAPTTKYSLTLIIPGAFNIDNALCAIGCAHAAGVATQKCIDALTTFTGIPGRMERIDEGQDFHVFVDFTVTPKSYEATLSTLKKALPSGKRLLVLTGSCGDRMKEKRPIVGKIVSEYADVMVVANEDPYTEDPEKIIDEVWAGIDQSKTDAHRIFDRRKAVEFLLNSAKSGDIVILCGKGSDTMMWVKDGQIPWNEREIVRDMLKHRSPQM